MICTVCLFDLRNNSKLSSHPTFTQNATSQLFISLSLVETSLVWILKGLRHSQHRQTVGRDHTDLSGAHLWLHSGLSLRMGVSERWGCFHPHIFPPLPANVLVSYKIIHLMACQFWSFFFFN